MSWRFLAATGFFVVFLGWGQAQGAVGKMMPRRATPRRTQAALHWPTRQPARQKRLRPRRLPPRGKSSTAKTKTKKSSGGAASPPRPRARHRRLELELSLGMSPNTSWRRSGVVVFWHVEADFERLNGVVSAVSGYAGGQVRNPNYEMVHEGITGHAEVVMVQYDPDIISYEDLLKEFFTKIHDPTTLNRQGPVCGRTQYRSIILFHNEAQRKAALDVYQKVVDARVWRNPIVTQLVWCSRISRSTA